MYIKRTGLLVGNFEKNHAPKSYQDNVFWLFTPKSPNSKTTY